MSCSWNRWISALSWAVVVCVVAVGVSCKAEKQQGQGPKPPETKGQASAQAKDAGMEPLPIVLPKPAFQGTPTNFQGIANLEAPLGKTRPPFLAPKGVTNVAKDKPVTGSVSEPIMGQLAMITDGDKEASDGSQVDLGPFTQQVTLDLQQEHEIFAILVWHYHAQARVYYDVVVQVSGDPDFVTGVQTVFNNDTDNSSGQGAGKDMHYVETSEGKLIAAKGAKGRYVRLYSRGNSSNDQNHYVEVEVYGRPVK